MKNIVKTRLVNMYFQNAGGPQQHPQHQLHGSSGVRQTSDILTKLNNNLNKFRRTALLMAIDNENMEMLELLLENKVVLVINLDG